MTKAYKRTALALLVLLGFIALLSGGRTIYYFFISALVVRLGALVMIKHHEKNLFVLYYASDTVVESGNPIKIEYKVSNTSMVPLAHCLIQFELDQKMRTTMGMQEMAFIMGQETLPFHKEMICKYRGYYKLGQVSLTFFDPLMLEKRTMNFSKTVDITVHPRIYPIHTMALDPRELFGTLKSDRRTLYDHTNLINIRKYERGDSLKNIHWKLSAKRDQWLTKEFQETIASKLVIVLDGSKESFTTLDDEEFMVSFCGSLMHQLLKEGVKVKLLLNDGYGTIVEGSDLHAFGRVLEVLTQFESRSDEPLGDFLRNEPTLGESVVIVTSKCSENSLEHINSHRGDVVLFTFFDGKVPATKHKVAYMDKVLEVQS